MRDKEVADGRLRLVLPTGIGSVEIVDDVAEGAVGAAWETIRAERPPGR